jgi:hypothetical protein
MCRLQAQEDVQAALTDDMVAMAGQLRAGAEAMSTAIADREGALDRASQGLLRSMEGVKQRVAETKRSVRRSRRSIWFTAFLILAVAAISLGILLHLSQFGALSLSLSMQMQYQCMHSW